MHISLLPICLDQRLKSTSQEFYEYPLVQGIAVSQKQIPSQLKIPKIDLSKLSDLKGTLVTQEAGLL